MDGMMADVTQAPPQFAALCQTLFGDVIDADVVWSDVSKLSPGPSDVATSSKKQGSLRRNIERGSNALGITAGGLGLAGALKDDRLADGGKVSRGLYATGQKMPKVFSRLGGKRTQAALAAGAAATQVGNLGGDFLIAGTLGASEKKAKREVRKAGSGTLVHLPKGVNAAATGLRQHWTNMTKPLMGAPKPKAALSPAQPTLPGLSTTAVPNPPSAAQKLGSNVMGAARSSEGKTGMAIGAGGTATLGAANTSRKKRAGGAGYEYAKRDDVVWEGTFSKLDTDQRLAFGWASVVSLNGAPVVDRQGDYIEPEEIEKAAYAYVHGSRVGGDMHRRRGGQAHKVSDLVESMVFTDDKIAKMGLPDDFPRGWWVGYKIHDDETWELVKKGERTGFSIHGKGVRKDHDLDELMGYHR